MIFRRIACVPHCSGARDCDIRVSCPYARMFEPSAIGQGPSGLADWPRPFVFRTFHLDGRTVAPGDSFSFDLNLFDTQIPAVAYLVLTFAQLAYEGLGPNRGRADLVDVTQLDAKGGMAVRVYDGASFLPQTAPPLTLSLKPVSTAVERARVLFLTPTELKFGRQLTPRPEFGVLAARIRDRVSTLRQLYDDGPLAMDFRGFGDLAARVRMVRCDIQPVSVRRRSSRTGQSHPVGGFIGEAEYEGNLAEFVPFLEAAKWTGVGRQTVWGKGEIRATWDTKAPG